MPLLIDIRLRRLAQVAILAYLMSLVAVLLLAAAAAVLQAMLDRLTDWPPLDGWVRGILQFVLTPYDTSLSSVLPIIAAAFPVIASQVCYGVDPGPPQRSSATLNRTGILLVMLCLFILVAAAADLALLSLYKGRMDEFVGRSTADRLEAFLKAQCGFVVLYLTQFAGLKPKS